MTRPMPPRKQPSNSTSNGGSASIDENGGSNSVQSSNVSTNASTAGVHKALPSLQLHGPGPRPRSMSTSSQTPRQRPKAKKKPQKAKPKARPRAAGSGAAQKKAAIKRQAKSRDEVFDDSDSDNSSDDDDVAAANSKKTASTTTTTAAATATSTTTTTATTTTSSTSTSATLKKRSLAPPAPRLTKEMQLALQSQQNDDGDDSDSDSDDNSAQPQKKQRSDSKSHVSFDLSATDSKRKSNKKKTPNQLKIEKQRVQQSQRDSMQLNAQQQNSTCCPNCESTDIEYDEKSGSAICITCGVVVEENAIVSSIEFSEAGGSSQVIGQFVSASMTKPFTPSGSRRGGRYGFSRDSRETTLTNGRRRIQDVASRLRLGSLFVDSAHRFFQIAVEKNFVQGRKTTHVVAACLYIACRQSKSQHMLIDFSDALQVNVYTLGTCFLKFRRLLGLKLEIIDPALYVYRFASHLELGEKANAVALTALRVTARMKRDWIVAGRRPAGVCAAALLIASRAHGFAKSQNDVTKILRVCGVTVNNRIKEFEYLPSARLTFEQFNTVELDAEADPPSFTQNRTSELRNKAIANGDMALLQSEECKDKLEGVMRTTGKTKIRREESALMYNETEKKLVNAMGQELSKEGQRLIIEAGDDGDYDETKTEEDEIKEQAERTLAVIKPNVQIADENGIMLEVAHWKASSTEKRMAIAKSESVKPYNPLKDQAPGTKTGGFYKSEESFSITDWIKKIPKDNDIFGDMDCLIRTEKEEKERDKIFATVNEPFLQKQEEKRLRQEKDKKDSEKKRLDAQEQESKAEAYEKQKESRTDSMLGPKKKKDKEKAAAAAAAAIPQADPDNIQMNVLNTLSARKVSRKIDYEAMSKIWTEGGKGFAMGGNNDNENDRSKNRSKNKNKGSDDDSDDDDSSSSKGDSESEDDAPKMKATAKSTKARARPTAKKKPVAKAKTTSTTKAKAKPAAKSKGAKKAGGTKKSDASVASKDSAKSKSSKKESSEAPKLPAYDSDSTDNSSSDSGGEEFAFV
ncbi:hypothetical protein TrVE_jg12599 [Triparma verrucosa]|uniref:B-related factor 1 n=1 Tax=Triparma verrucosa TaxID=1606542 RepID=A0A9W7FJF8_9STRA|nr:hypothetical protein TrVE_jg12599 [Triparma verrucosa]